MHTTTSPLGQKRFSPSFLPLELYSFGVGDRFAQQAKAQLQAVMLASANGVQITPVWNKSYREHSIIGSEPASVLSAALEAARAVNWTKPFHVDADHVTLEQSGKTTPRGQAILAHTPMARFGEAQDLVGATLWLLSPASAFVTGAVVPIDGGFSAFGGV